MGLITTPPNRGPLRCAIYARVSPKPEGAAGDNFSIKSQLHEMKALALKEFGCAAPDEYIDKDKSGATLDRPSLDRLRDNIALKLYDVVIAYSPDRWSRGDEMDNVILDQELKKGGARLAFVSGSYDDTPEGELSRSVQNAVSRYERKKFRERARRCRRQKSRDGYPHSCHPPDGYRYEGHRFGKKGEYVIVPERAKIIRIIFVKTAQGMTNSRLAIWLNEQGIQTHSAWLKEQGIKTRETRNRWFRNSVARVVEKTAYYGVLIQNGERIEVPEIIPRELWDRAREASARNKVGRVGRPSNEYLLSGLLWCARAGCDKRCGTYPNNGYPAYRCNNIDHANRSIRFCFAPQILKSIIEPIIWNAVWDAVCAPGLLWQLIEAYHGRVAGRETKKDPAIARIDRARRLVARQEQILSDPDQPVPYAQAKSQLEAARRELAEAQTAGSAAVAMMPLRKDVEAASAEFRAMREELETFADRKEALDTLVEKIRYADGRAEIHCHLPRPRNCHSRIRDEGNFPGSYPFVINVERVA